MSRVIVGLVALVAVLAFVGLSSLFYVYQTEQAIVLRFGEPIRIIQTPGLHAKIPFVDAVTRIDNRILDLDLPEREATTNDQQRLVVDAFSRFRITDPLRFRQAAGTVEVARARLSNVLTDALLETIRSNGFREIVRDRRDQLVARIREQANREAARFGINIVDVRIRRADLPEQNSQSVFERMRTDRQQEAAGIRALGSQEAQGIRARSDREVAVILAEANRDGERLRGEGDSERSRIFAEAFTRDPEFFAFYRSMQAYEAGLKPNGTRLVITPDSAFFRYFQNPTGGAAPSPIPTGAAPRPAAPAGGPAPAAPAPAAPNGTAPAAPPVTQ